MPEPTSCSRIADTDINRQAKPGVHLKITAVLSTTLLVATVAAGTNQTRERKPERGEKQSQAMTVGESGAISSSPLASKFTRAWQYLTESPGSVPPSMDTRRVYIPLSDGRIACLDRQSGSLLWSAAPGGSITVPISIGKQAIYVATEKLSEEGLETGASMRSLDPETGLTRWAKDYPRPFQSPIVAAGDRLYAGSADGAFYSLSADDGRVLWKAQTQNAVRGRPELIGETVYFGADDGALYGVACESGQQVWKYQASGRIVGQPASDSRNIYFGSGDGFVYSVDRASTKLRWRARVGAAVETSPIIVQDKILVGSFDNFLYALSRSSGDRLWKRRLDNRVASDPIVEGDATLVAPLRGNYLMIFLNSDGRRVGYYPLGRGSEIIAGPIYLAGTLLLPTDKGLIALKVG